VENANERYLRFLLTMITENPEIKTKWGKPHVLQAIMFHINDTLNSEYGIRPFTALFGVEDIVVSWPRRAQRVHPYLYLTLVSVLTSYEKSTSIYNNVAQKHGMLARKSSGGNSPKISR
jgi:hypothetical protein